MVIARSNQIWNCKLLDLNGISIGVIEIRGLRTSSHCQICWLYDIAHYFFYYKPRAVAKLRLVYISRHDSWYVDFLMKYVRWQPWQIERFPKLCSTINRFICFYNSVDRLACDCFALNVGLNNIIRLIDVFGHNRKNRSFTNQS